MFQRRFATTRRSLTCLLLMWLVAGALPLPLMHLHGNEIEPGDSAQLALHLELRHAGHQTLFRSSAEARGCDSNVKPAADSEWHCHWFWIPDFANEGSEEPYADHCDLWDSTPTLKTIDLVQHLAVALLEGAITPGALTDLVSQGSLFEPSPHPEQATCPALSMLRRLNQ